MSIFHVFLLFELTATSLNLGYKQKCWHNSFVEIYNLSWSHWNDIFTEWFIFDVCYMFLSVSCLI